ncbi:histone H1.9-like [Ctenodactylus gundi]
MQRDTSPPSAPLASNTAVDGAQQVSVLRVPTKRKSGFCASHKDRSRPSMSKVILDTVADNGARHRTSLAALKKAVATRGYDMTRNAWRFKRTLKQLVDKGMLKQVTGKGALGSFRLGKKQASKSKLKAKKQPRQPRSGKRRSGQRRSGEHQSKQRRSLLGSKQGHKQLFKGVRRVAKCRYN